MPSLDAEDQIYQEGMAARRLLEAGDFAAVLNALSDAHLKSLVDTPVGPAHADKRDHHHRMIAAMREVALEVATRAHALDTLESEKENPEEDYE